MFAQKRRGAEVESSVAPSRKPTEKAPSPGAAWTAFALRNGLARASDAPARDDYFARRFSHEFSKIPTNLPNHAPIQRKADVEVGSPSDPLELEADRAADAVMRGASPNVLPAGQVGAPQRAVSGAATSDSDASGALSSADVGDHVARALADGGAPLSPATRAFFEPRFGTSFDHVRVHHGVAAKDAAAALHARAFTVGRDVVFGANEYVPDMSSGRRLLAHELAHTVQSVPGTRVLRQPNGDDPGGDTGGAKRIVYLDGNVIDQINRGNAPAAQRLRTLLTMADVRISDYVYDELVTEQIAHGWAEVGTANRLFIEDLHIKVESPTTMAQRSEVGIGNWNANEKARQGPIQHKDIPVLAAMREPGAELWTFDGFAKNPKDIEKRFGKKIAPESLQIDAIKTPQKQDPQDEYPTGRQLMNLDPVVIDQTGKILRRGRQGSVTRGGTTSNVPSGVIVSGEIDTSRGSVTRGGMTRPVPSGGTASGVIVVPETAGRGSVVAPGATRPVRSGDIVSGEIIVPEPAIRGAVTRGGATQPVRSGEIVSGEINTEEGGGGGGGGAVAVGVGGAIVDAIAVPIINHYLQDYLADWREEGYRKVLSKALNDATPKYRAAIDADTDAIRGAQSNGRLVSMHVVVRIVFVDGTDPHTGISPGQLPTNATVEDVQIVLEGGSPRPYSPDTNLAGDFFRSSAGTTFSYESFDFPIDGTNMKVRHQHEVAKTVEAAWDSRHVPFEKLIVESQYGKLSADTLREYAEYRREGAKPSGAVPIGRTDDSSAYWSRQEALTSAPLEQVIVQAKIKSVALANLRAYAVRMRDAGNQDATHWAAIIRLIDAPLEDRYAVEHQEFLWAQGGSKDEIAKQQQMIDSLEKQIADGEALAESLLSVDARTRAERDGGEPPHPPWARINDVETKNKALREELWIQKRLLKDLQKN